MDKEADDVTRTREENALDGMREELEQVAEDLRTDEDWLEQHEEYSLGDCFAPVQSIGYEVNKMKVIAVPMPWGDCPVAAGPYLDKPKEDLYFGVKMAAEIKAPCVIDVPTKDFGIPDADDVEFGIAATLGLMRLGRIPYIGCRGGIGRTGTFLAILAKVGLESTVPWYRRLAKPVNPVDWVRQFYLPHACETEDQKQFVHKFNTRWLAELAKQLAT